jgi:hypothetical protein
MKLCFPAILLLTALSTGGAASEPNQMTAVVPVIRITRQPLCGGAISPFQNGQFIEYLCGLTLSMSAEQVFDGSFEGVPPYKFVFRKETDRLEKPWYPEVAVHRGKYALDAENPFNGKQSQRIAALPGDPCTLGIAQAGKYVRRDVTLKCSLSLRMRGLQNPVGIAISGEGKTYATAEVRPGETWRRFTVELTPNDTDENAVLSISFRGPGTLWIDQVSLLPADHLYGWRRDVTEAIKALWCARYQNPMHRNCDILEIANRSNLCDSFCSGIIQTNNHALFKTPTYYVQELYGNHVGKTPLMINFDGEKEDAALDLSAALAADAKTLAIFTVNHTASPQKRTLDLSAFAPRGETVEVHTLQDTAKSPERHAVNSWREPDRIRTVRSQVKFAGDQLPYEFPPFSVTLLEAQPGVNAGPTTAFGGERAVNGPHRREGILDDLHLENVCDSFWPPVCFSRSFPIRHWPR